MPTCVKGYRGRGMSQKVGFVRDKEGEESNNRER